MMNTETQEKMEHMRNVVKYDYNPSSVLNLDKEWEWIWSIHGTPKYGDSCYGGSCKDREERADRDLITEKLHNFSKSDIEIEMIKVSQISVISIWGYTRNFKNTDDGYRLDCNEFGWGGEYKEPKIKSNLPKTIEYVVNRLRGIHYNERENNNTYILIMRIRGLLL